MAGLAAGFSLAPRPPLAFSVKSTSSHSHHFACSLRLLAKPSPSTWTWRRAARTPARLAVVARAGGRRSWETVSDPDYDPNLDIDRVQASSVRLLDEEQNMVGVVPLEEALEIAQEADLTLAILSADADPPVLRLFEEEDYRKYKYEQQKKKRVQQKRSSAGRMDMKELKMGYNIDIHDYSVRLKAAKKFLKDGDKVKVIVNLKGRENEFRNVAIELIKRFQNDIGELATEESKNFRERNIFMMLTPNKAVTQKGQEQQKKKETPQTPETPVTEVSASV